MTSRVEKHDPQETENQLKQDYKPWKFAQTKDNWLIWKSEKVFSITVSYTHLTLPTKLEV